MTSGGTAELLLSGIVLIGASVQWLTGMGFALIAVPALVLVLGPAEGVVLANCAAGAISPVGRSDGRATARIRPQMIFMERRPVGRALSNRRRSRDILISSNVADVERSTR